MYRLLVVDDRQEVCDGIVKLLDWNSYDFTTVATATTYQEAISKAVDLQPHIALVSVRIGHHFGYELAAYIRSIGMKTVFCVIFGYDDPPYMQKCMQAGVRDYLQNAPDPKELQLFVERTIIRDFKGTIPSAVNLQGKIDQVLNMDYTGFSSITNKIILYVKSNYRYSLSLSSINSAKSSYCFLTTSTSSSVSAMGSPAGATTGSMESSVKPRSSIVRISSRKSGFAWVKVPRI